MFQVCLKEGATLLVLWMILPGAYDDLPQWQTSTNQVPESDLQNICGARARVSGARLVR